jgi:hypothetical protein
MRKTWIISLLAMVAIYGRATTVTGTVTDSDGQTWNNGAITATFVPGPSGTGTHGTIPSPVKAALNGSGAFSMTVAANSTFTPPGSKWRFTVCPNATTGCVSATLVISGASESISTQLSAHPYQQQTYERSECYGKRYGRSGDWKFR